LGFRRQKPNDLFFDISVGWIKRSESTFVLLNKVTKTNLVNKRPGNYLLLVASEATFKSQKIPQLLMICSSLKMRKVIYSGKSGSQKLVFLHRSGILI